jgi:uncharacterized phage protein (TIGR01671 family)
MNDNVGGCYIYPIDSENLYKENEVIPDTVGQSTGLYDKDGNEIYEGDVVLVDFDRMDMVKTYAVEWSNHTAAFVLSMFPGSGYGLFMDKEFVEKSVKVIGNIYNPKEEDKEYNSIH